MQRDRRILVESIVRLLRRGGITNLRNILSKTHSADLSRVFRSLRINEQKKLFEIIEDLEQKGVLLYDLDQDILLDMIEGLRSMIL